MLRVSYRDRDHHERWAIIHIFGWITRGVVVVARGRFQGVAELCTNEVSEQHFGTW